MSWPKGKDPSAHNDESTKNPQKAPSDPDENEDVDTSQNQGVFSSMLASSRRKASFMSHAKRRIFVNIPIDDDFADGDENPVFEYKSNKVRTSKYTLVTFLPKNIFEQFRGVANFFFLSLIILQMFNEFKEVDIIITALPVIIIVAATAIKDAFEDWRRHDSDNSVNKAQTYLLSHYDNSNYGRNNVSIILRIRKILKSGRKLLFSSLIKGIKFLYQGVSGLTSKQPSYESTAQDPSAAHYPEVIYGVDYINETVYANNPNNPNVRLEPFQQPDAWKKCNWEDVRVGDFVYLRNNDSIPADILIISTSEPDSLCYVETKNLDGETNLKIKKGLNVFSHIRTPEDCHNVFCHIDSEPPNANLYSYYGTLVIRAPVGEVDEPESRTVIPVSLTGMLLRGSVLRNTKWLIGIVIYTGADTKIVLNSGETPSKRSRIDRQLSPQVFLNFVILVSISGACALAAAVYAVSFVYEEAPFSGFGPDQDGPLMVGILTFFRCIIMYQNIIPIALYISLEGTKTVQSWLIHVDEEMRDPDSDKLVTAQSWNLCDDLGQIEYIFSDKTGTLTSNTMEFRGASINGIIYGSFDDNAHQSSEKEMRTKMKELFDMKYVTTGKLAFVDKRIPEHMKESTLQAAKIREFFTLLAVCHTVLVERKDKSSSSSSSSDPQLTYNAQSPDEAALVSAAKDNGFAFVKRDNNTIEIDVLGHARKYTILNVIEFNSDRKRMSVVVRRPEGDILLLTKGADSIIFERLSAENDQPVIDRTSEHLGFFANQGLRTLCLAFRPISQEEYHEWSEKYRAAQALVENRQEASDAVAELIEQDLTLMGATAIEDKLQDGVPESIATLAKAGIKLWVLTGDKMETAINIGFSCNLLRREMTLIVLKASSIDEVIDQLKEALVRFWNKDGTHAKGSSFALIIDGETLKHALDPLCKPILLEMACRCKSVICCRVSPLQKALVVQLVRKGLGAMCLAIGDGANDVSMIQEADIGIGISGKEGLQAVMASDYAIAQFRFLTRLLLVHGRWAYLRSSSMVLNFFYKNAVWLFILLWHQFYCAFSGNIITDFTYGMYYNTFFTIVPTVFIGTFDQDVSAEMSLLAPQIYYKGIFQSLYSMTQFWLVVLDAIYQSLICYFFAFMVYDDATPNIQGFDGGVESMGGIIAMSVVLIVNFYVLINWNTWTILTFIAIFVSLFFWIGYFVMYSTISGSTTYGLYAVTWNSAHFYFSVVLIISLSLFPRLLAKFIQQYFYPHDTDIIQEFEKFHYKRGEPLPFDIKSPAPETQMEDLKTTGTEKDTDSIPLEAVSSGADRPGPPKKTRSIIEVQKFASSEPVFKRAKSDELATKPSTTQATGSSTPAVPISVDPVGYIVSGSTTSADASNDVISSDGFGISPSKPKIPQSQQTRIQTLLGGGDFGPHSRRPSISSVLRTGVERASQFVRRLVPGMPPRTTHGPSLIYLGDHGRQVANTGFAFSQDTGMTDVISPGSRTTFDDSGAANPFIRPRRRGPVSRLRNISNRLSNVIHINLVPSGQFALPRLYTSSISSSNNANLSNSNGLAVPPPPVGVPVAVAEEAEPIIDIEQDTEASQTAIETEKLSE